MCAHTSSLGCAVGKTGQQKNETHLAETAAGEADNWPVQRLSWTFRYIHIRLDTNLNRHLGQYMNIGPETGKGISERQYWSVQHRSIHWAATEGGVYCNRQEPMCRVASQKIQHIMAACKIKAGTAYTEQQNQVAHRVYRNTAPSTDWSFQGPYRRHQGWFRMTGLRSYGTSRCRQTNGYWQTNQILWW